MQTPDAGRWTFAFVLIATAGCARLSPGTFTPAHPQNVLLLRGYLDWYSTGIDQLAAEIRSDGCNAQAFREEQWGDLADSLLAHPPSPLILVGFSYGADDVILIARRLNQQQVPVDLLITLDPVTPAQIPSNVKRCVNFYEPNGFWDIFPWLRGVPVASGSDAQNINVRSRPDLDEPGMSHATIAADAKLHAAIRSLIVHCACGRSS